MNYIQNWVFTYNPYTHQWCGAKREDAKELFNNFNSPSVLRSSKIETLQELITKYKGDIKAIQKIK